MSNIRSCFPSVEALRFQQIPAGKMFIFYLQYPHFFHTRISQIACMIGYS